MPVARLWQYVKTRHIQRKANRQNTAMKVNLRMSADALETKVRLNHSKWDFFYGSDIWLVGSLFTEKPKISLNLCCWYHPVTVNFTTKVSREFSAFGNFLGFKWLALWFSTFYRTRWRETTDSLLYQVSLFCILLQCYLFNLCHFIIQLISMTNLVF